MIVRRSVLVFAITVVALASGCGGTAPKVDEPAAASTTTSTINTVLLETELEVLRAECASIRLTAAITNSVGRDSHPAVKSMFTDTDQEIQDRLRAARLRAEAAAQVAQPAQLELACLDGQ